MPFFLTHIFPSGRRIFVDAPTKKRAVAYAGRAMMDNSYATRADVDEFCDALEATGVAAHESSGYAARVDRAPKTPKEAGTVTPADVRRYPEFYIIGPGREAAEQSNCGHGYSLVDSCPIC
jgi:hypothetical protein